MLHVMPWPLQPFQCGTCRGWWPRNGTPSVMCCSWTWCAHLEPPCSRSDFGKHKQQLVSKRVLARAVLALRGCSNSVCLMAPLSKISVLISCQVGCCCVISSGVDFCSSLLHAVPPCDAHPALDPRLLHHLPPPSPPYRSEALRVLSEVFAAAARPSKGGFVRDALTASYPRLVTLLESTLNRINTDSRIKVGNQPFGVLSPSVRFYCHPAAAYIHASLTHGSTQLKLPIHSTLLYRVITDSRIKVGMCSARLTAPADQCRPPSPPPPVVLCRVLRRRCCRISCRCCWMRQHPSGMRTCRQGWCGCRRQSARHSLAAAGHCRAQQMCRSALGK